MNETALVLGGLIFGAYYLLTRTIDRHADDARVRLAEIDEKIEAVLAEQDRLRWREPPSSD